MKRLILSFLVLFLALQGCRKTQKPDTNNPKSTKYTVWGRIGAQTLSDNYTGTPIINKVSPKSPAEQGGLRVGDRIVSINGIDAPDLDIARFIQSRKPKTRVIFKINRGTLTRTLSITVGSFPRLEQLTLLTLENIRGKDYTRAADLLKNLQNTDTANLKTREIARLRQMLLGKKTIPDRDRTPSAILLLLKNALEKSLDLYRAEQLITLYKRKGGRDVGDFQKLRKSFQKLTGE